MILEKRRTRGGVALGGGGGSNERGGLDCPSGTISKGLPGGEKKLSINIVNVKDRGFLFQRICEKQLNLLKQKGGFPNRKKSLQRWGDAFVL